MKICETSKEDLPYYTYDNIKLGQVFSWGTCTVKFLKTSEGKMVNIIPNHPHPQ